MRLQEPSYPLPGNKALKAAIWEWKDYIQGVGCVGCCLGVYVSWGSSWLFYRCSRGRQVSMPRRRPASSRATSCVRPSLRTCWVRSRRILWRKQTTIAFTSASTHCWVPAEDPFPQAFHKGPPSVGSALLTPRKLTLKALQRWPIVPSSLCRVSSPSRSSWNPPKTKRLRNAVSLMPEPSSECWMSLHVLSDVIVGIQPKAVLSWIAGGSKVPFVAEASLRMAVNCVCSFSCTSPIIPSYLFLAYTVESGGFR